MEHNDHDNLIRLEEEVKAFRKEFSNHDAEEMSRYNAILEGTKENKRDIQALDSKIDNMLNAWTWAGKTAKIVIQITAVFGALATLHWADAVKLFAGIFKP